VCGTANFLARTSVPTYLRRSMQFALQSTDPSLVRSGAGIAEVMEPAKLYAIRGPGAPS